MQREVRVRFHTPNGLHNRFMTEGIARLFRAAGFVRPRLALETASARSQAETGGKTTHEEFMHAIDCFENAGYAADEIACYILIGLPGQTMAEIRDSVEFAAARGVRIFLEEYSPIPGTPDYKKSGLPACNATNFWQAGLAEGADPLLHNNSAFPLYNLRGYNALQQLKSWAHTLNKP